MYIRSRSKQTKTVKTQDLFFFFITEPLIYDEMGASNSKKGMPTGHSHTDLTTEKPITACQKN